MLLDRHKHLDKMDRDVLYKEEMFYMLAMSAKLTNKEKKMIYIELLLGRRKLSYNKKEKKPKIQLSRSSRCN